MNKTLTSIFILLFLFTSCSQKASKSNSTTLIGSVKKAVAQIQDYRGDVKEFQLGLTDELVADSFSMAIITDAMLKKGWTFNGSEKVKGGKIHFYKEM